MQIITISEGQTLLDIAARYCGDASLAFDIAELNGINIDDIVVGANINVPDYLINKKAIVEYLRERNVIPASALDDNTTYEDEWTLFYTTGLPPTHG
jgi:hypothetical protein